MGGLYMFRNLQTNFIEKSKHSTEKRRDLERQTNKQTKNDIMLILWSTTHSDSK